MSNMNFNQLKDKLDKIKADEVNRVMFNNLLKESENNPYGVIYSIINTLNDCLFFIDKLGLLNEFYKEIESKRIKNIIEGFIL